MEYAITIQDLRKELTDAQSRVKTLEDECNQLDADLHRTISERNEARDRATGRNALYEAEKNAHDGTIEARNKLAGQVKILGDALKYQISHGFSSDWLTRLQQALAAKEPKA